MAAPISASSGKLYIGGREVANVTEFRVSASDNVDRQVRDIDTLLGIPIVFNPYLAPTQVVMGHVPPRPPARREVPQSASATLENLQAVEEIMRAVRNRTREQDKVQELLAYTGRQPLPSEQQILERPKRKITLE